MENNLIRLYKFARFLRKLKLTSKVPYSWTDEMLLELSDLPNHTRFAQPLANVRPENLKV